MVPIADHHFTPSTPWRRSGVCESSTATARSLSKRQRAAAATTVGRPASARRRPAARRSAAELSTGCASPPIGTCHGLNSPHSPRIVTSVSNGKRQFADQRQHVDAVADAAGLHQQHRALAAEPGAGGSATPSSSVVSTRARWRDRSCAARSAANGRHRARSRPA